MIIKSMSRKDASFGQILAYISRDAADRRFELRHNLLGQNLSGVTAEFEANGGLLQKRKNGVALYHEIISITRAASLSEDVQKEALRAIALDYIQRRCPQALVYGMLHDDRGGQLHYHLVISANAFGASRRHRLSKDEFRKIQLDLEAHVLQTRPELEQRVAMGSKTRPEQLSQPGAELKRRTGKTPQRTALKNKAVAAFEAARDPQDLFRLLTGAELELYRRGKNIGIRDLATGRNHRLATLGLVQPFQSMSKRFDMANKDQNQKTPVTHLSNGATANGTPRAAFQKPKPNPKHDVPQVRALTSELLPNTVGAVAKETTGMIEIAVHQAGGPKPFEPAAKAAARNASQTAAQAAKPEQKSQGPSVAEIAKEHKAEIEKLRKDLDQNRHQDTLKLKL